MNKSWTRSFLTIMLGGCLIGGALYAGTATKICFEAELAKDVEAPMTVVNKTGKNWSGDGYIEVPEDSPKNKGAAVYKILVSDPAITTCGLAPTGGTDAATLSESRLTITPPSPWDRMAHTTTGTGSKPKVPSSIYLPASIPSSYSGVSRASWWIRFSLRRTRSMSRSASAP